MDKPKVLITLEEYTLLKSKSEKRYTFNSYFSIGGYQYWYGSDVEFDEKLIADLKRAKDAAATQMVDLLNVENELSEIKDTWWYKMFSKKKA